jgi:hypothetical protein
MGARPQRGLTYHFTAGQTFAYSVEIEVREEGFSQLERLTGMPYITVKSVDDSGEAELFIIGKLESSTRRGENDTVHPSRAVWLASRIALQPSGAWSGKSDVNSDALPDYFRTLNLELRRLIFPEVPKSVPSVHDSSGNAKLFVSGNRSSFGNLGLGMLDGRATTTDHADPLDAQLVRLLYGVRFETNASVQPHVLIDYRSSGRFDRDLGRLRDFDSTFRKEQTGRGTVVATARVRLLDADGLKRAYAQSVADWQERPDVLDPIEFRRVRANAFLPETLPSTREAVPGLTVYHLRTAGEGVTDPDNRYYVAQVVETVSETPPRVKIRYKGSNEELTVHPGTLAYPPSAEHPGRAQRAAAR